MDSSLSYPLGGLKLLPSFALGILALLMGYIAINEYLRRKSMIPGLASPPQNVVFGHLPYFAQKGVAEPCREWSEEYGPVYQIKLGNITAVTVNTAAAAKQIFSHQSHATSSRPELYTLHKVRPRYCQKRYLQGYRGCNTFAANSHLAARQQRFRDADRSDSI